MRVGLVTCRVLPEPDPDAPILSAALQARGHTPVNVIWDSDADTPRTDVLILRSTWNYYERPADFLAWVDRVSEKTPLLNNADVVRWNIHKRYLSELAAADVPTVPTSVVHRGDSPESVTDLMDAMGSIVIKPAIGAASAGVRRFDAVERSAALRWAAEILTQSDILVQPYLAGFQSPGERSLIWIDGVWTHAIQKSPRFAGEHERVESGRPPAGGEVMVATQALQCVPAGCRYARADIVLDDSGRPVISELELMEPSLYFAQSSEALRVFIRMIEHSAGVR